MTLKSVLIQELQKMYAADQRKEADELGRKLVKAELLTETDVASADPKLRQVCALMALRRVLNEVTDYNASAQERAYVYRRVVTMKECELMAVDSFLQDRGPNLTFNMLVKGCRFSDRESMEEVAGSVDSIPQTIHAITYDMQTYPFPSEEARAMCLARLRSMSVKEQSVLGFRHNVLGQDEFMRMLMAGESFL